MDLCSGGGKVDLTPTLLGSSLCTLTITEEHLIGANAYDNDTNAGTGKMDIEVTAHTGEEIHVEEDPGGDCEIGTITEAEYVGNVTFKGTDASGNAVGVTWDE